MDTKTLVKRLRYQGRQYQQGQVARGGDGDKHILTQAADTIDELAAMVEKLRIIAESFNQKHCNYIVKLDCTIQDVLDTAPPQALNAIRAEAAEETIENMLDLPMRGYGDGRFGIPIEDIRNMARKYKEE